MALRGAEVAGRLLDCLLDRTVVGGYSRWGYLLRTKLPGWPADAAQDALEGRSVLVTGANSGLGKATVAMLARVGARVHMVVRDPSKGHRAREQILREVPGADLRVWRCDVSDLADVRRFADEFTAAESALHALVHNAGVMPTTRTESAQGHELSLATHVLGPLLMTESLRPALRAAGGGRVIMVSSGGMYGQKLPVDDPEYREGRYRGAAGYARAKRIQVAITPMLAQRLAVDGTSVYVTHPGWVDTPGLAASLPGFQRLTKPLLRALDEGADTVVWLVGVRPARESGGLWHDRRSRPVHLMPFTRHSEADAQRMWIWCAQQARVRT